MIGSTCDAIIQRVELELLAKRNDAFDHPTTTLAFAQSLDGSISSEIGAQIQLSNLRSQTMTHDLRARHGAILVGINTVLVDDPQLTVRLVDGPSPRPVVVDNSLRFPLRARMLNGGSVRPIIATTFDASTRREDRLRSAGADVIRLPADHVGRVDLGALLCCLRRLNICSLMVEGGTGVITSFLLAGLADRVVMTICPVLVGGVPAITVPTAAQRGKLPPLYEPLYAYCDGDLILCASFRPPDNGICPPGKAPDGCV